MSDPRQAGPGLCVLALHVVESAVGPDHPVVSIHVDGVDPFRAVAPDWLGFGPDAILGPASPLLPTDFGRRVAVNRCSCGEPGCGVIAPLIVGSPDGRRISWVDFRNYVGVFLGPVEDAIDHEGRTWPLPDLHFDRSQYVDEVARATADLSWETPRRRCARLVQERLTSAGAGIPPRLELRRVFPSWRTTGFVVDLVFTHVVEEPEFSVERAMLRLASDAPHADDAATDIVERLLADSPSDWVAVHGHDPSRG